MLPNPEPDPNPWFNLLGSNPEVPVALGFVPPNPPVPKLALAALGSTRKRIEVFEYLCYFNHLQYHFHSSSSGEPVLTQLTTKRFSAEILVADAIKLVLHIITPKEDKL